ncbi:SMR family transporter [Brevibacterium sp. 50QC2O2]|uniref:DMT family transporter n=1 Tax=Brevibacterium TaxID=1696 RepID=UPI00211D109A|nr:MULTISPECIES: SMR family transporter [unclassified Brevibacterium]MCQ9384727.1 SMR family transporter [Brevibacterium sp. 68QC2CO]MCQ9387490.1 SMR family transporter [Brevibacterium sp. 50QC2O2]
MSTMQSLRAYSPTKAWAWPILIVAGMFEAVWAHALDAGLFHPWNLAGFVIGMALSVGGLQVAMRRIPLGTAYAVWAGVGTAATAVWAAVAGEPFSIAKILFLALVLIGVVGLELTTPAEDDR